MEDHDIPHDDELVEAIANVLAVSQQYMREQKVTYYLQYRNIYNLLLTCSNVRLVDVFKLFA